ncbi:MAG TPA: hypothetical protein VKH18_06100 [Terriglobales bacterium]|nr:hypothetical protein [Terriglobales bacterium]
MNFLRTCLAVLLGFILGALLYHPQVKASTSITVTAVKAGYSPYVPGDTVVGFACTADTCYIATR